MDKPFLIDEWRRIPADVQGAIVPEIFFQPCELSGLVEGDLMICAADRPFLNKYLGIYTEHLVKGVTPNTAVYLFCPNPSDDDIAFLQSLNESMLPKGVAVFGCTQSRIARILSNLPRQGQFEYMINYIKSLRYYFALQAIVPLLGDKTVSDSFVVCSDLDIQIRKGISGHLREVAGKAPLIATFNSHKKPFRQSFSRNLCCTFEVKKPLDDETKTLLDIPFHIIKGGIAARPSRVSQSLLQRIVFYLHGSDRDPMFARLFTYYYGDQVAVYLAINDLSRYFESTGMQPNAYIAWLDYATSPVANLDSTVDSCVYVMKGKGWSGASPVAPRGPEQGPDPNQ
jgi:hypothetical protein